MNSRCRGVACIINVQEDRCGTDLDRDRLQQLFHQLHFDVEIYNDADGLSAKVRIVCLLGLPLLFTISLLSEGSNDYGTQNVLNGY